jgi:D-alanine-D-alanine ligase
MLNKLKIVAEETLPKLINKRIFILTGTGAVSRAEKIELLSEIDTFEVASDVFETLVCAGFKKLLLFPATPHNLNCIELLKSDLFINLVEGVGASFTARAIEEIKKTGVPFTGSDAEPIRISTDKNQTKQAVEKAGVKVAPSQLFRDAKDKPDEKLGFPIILKPKRDDGSAGITNDSVVKNEEELKLRLTEMLPRFTGPIMGEQYIDGREFSATVIEVNGQALMLPIAEVHFPERGFKSKWKIYNYAAKWVPNSPEIKTVYANAPAKNLATEVEQQLTAASLTAFKVLGLHDYARFDFRMDDKTNAIYFLEANANPSLEENPQVETTASFQSIGLTQLDFLVLIMKSALERFGKKV